ncbi:MAG: hypothetical protein L6420_01960 [Elusimicrobia bacterium]|nr:hypothetical protein [Candidatus Omnitrophota bacterium]MCG2725017.1 hypothetical protein [Elusimicrobiota bacterium]
MPKEKETIYRVARTRDELEEAFSLVYKEYAGRGYIPKHYKSTLRLSLHNAVPSTVTFVALQDNRVIATVTLIPDSVLGLPMDSIFKEEVDVLRKGGLKVAEVSQLSLDGDLFPKNWFSLFNFNKLAFVFKLFKLVLDYSFYTAGLNELCIAINPSHQYLYKFISFKQMGGLKHYGSVNKAPAIAFKCDLTKAKEKLKNRKGLYKMFFGGKTLSESLEKKYTLTNGDLEYFFMKKSDIFEKASPEQLMYIKSCYPHLSLKGDNAEHEH